MAGLIGMADKSDGIDEFLRSVNVAYWGSAAVWRRMAVLPEVQSMSENQGGRGSARDSSSARLRRWEVLAIAAAFAALWAAALIFHLF